MPDSSLFIGRQFRTSTQTGFYVAKVKIPGLPSAIPQSVVLGSKPELVLAATALGAAYPNPAQEEAFIPYHLPKGTRSAQVLLTDITGRQVSSYALKGQQGRLPVSLSNMQNGLYLYTLVLDGKPAATRKLAVAR